MNSSPDGRVEIASQKRKGLAVYLDYLGFATIWGLALYFLLDHQEVPWWIPLVVFVGLEWVSLKTWGSLGQRILGIDGDGEIVDLNLFDRENWMTVTLGVVLILEGTKHMVRWTKILVITPVFGFIPESSLFVSYHVFMGVLFVTAGYGILRLDFRGWILSLLLTLVEVVSMVLSWDLWGPVVEQFVTARREVQGVPVREGEVEFIQKLFPDVIVAGSLIVVLVLLINVKRFRTT